MFTILKQSLYFATKYQRFFSVTMKGKTIILNKKFQGFPRDENFKIVEESVPQIKDGEFLVQAEYLSVDPYIRVFMKAVGAPIMGEQVAKIIESKNPKYPVGEYVVGEFGWRTHTVASEKPGDFFSLPPRVLSFGDLPKSLALGVLGMTGVTALYGLQLCEPAEGKTLVVSGAAGAVGTHVGQLAKMQGCKVVGVTGSDAKGQRLVKELNFDAFVNYKSENFEKDLAAATPQNIDCYFDNVGGDVSSSVLHRMNKFGHVVICGAISTYNDENTKAREVQTPVKVNHLVMEGFSVTRWRNKWNKAVEDNLKLIQEGRLKYFETITEGFENTPEAFMKMLRGENFGKAIVKV
ncbi:prostaglandin reductase 1-like isoform X1 [Tribolium madens]|uniref:prostaglandin reductase 1-like isoform X1 n=2 Tax=Tribolium madens TaxID=41895 RepID=UPI001CF750AA|nr:prostaglandin reductase 1-like isoform X1 [Tribolium madens]